MEFLRFLRKESGAYGTRIAGITLLGGVASGVMMIIILGAASTATEPMTSLQFLALFALTLSAIMLTKRYSLNHTTRLTETIVERLRVRVSDKIRRAELAYFENTGPTLFATVLTKETQLISTTASATINATASVVMLLVSFLFIAYLSVSAFMVTLAAIAVAVLAYRHSLMKVQAQLHETIAAENQFFDLLNHMLAGFKELKMDAKKNRDLFDRYLVPLSARVRELKIKTNAQFADTTLIVHAAFYALIGVIVFVLPKIADCDLNVIMRVTAVVLFIFGPLSEVIGIVPQIARASVAIHTIERLEQSLDDEVTRATPVDHAAPVRPWTFSELEVRELKFSYLDSKGAPGYTVGPLDVKISAGEILFLKGGNGSGKSTFLKLLTGLYTPSSGQILLDGKPVTAASYHRYRNIFSVIFTDFHLFDRLYGLESIDDEKLANLIDEMELTDKTRFHEGRFTELNLSTGQRKRLALIVALLEGKQVLVFDEWAADQDPSFRKQFYEVILPALKKEGKTIIAATHDDHYFHIADHVLKMDYGRFVQED